jgi:hypothetical protein
MNRSLVRRYTLSGIIKTSFRLIFQHFRELFGGAIIVLAPWQMLDWFVKNHMPHSNATVALQVLSFFALQLATPLLLLQVNDVVRGLKPGLRRSLRLYASDRIWPFVGTYIVVTLAVALGYLFLVIPGLIMTAFYLFAMIIATLEGKSVRQSMRKSRLLGKGCYVRNVCVVFASWFAIGLPIMVVYIIAAAILGFGAGWFFPAAIQEGSLLTVLQLVVGLLASVVVPPVVLPQILLYYDMRARKEGLDDNRFVEELRLAGFDADHREKEGAAWIPVRS